MPKEWMIFISTLGTYTTLAEVILQILTHNSMLVCDRPSQGAPAVVRALATAQNQQSQAICTNPVCGCVGHNINKCFKPGGRMEGHIVKNLESSMKRPLLIPLNPTASLSRLIKLLLNMSGYCYTIVDYWQ